jgi:hypothetical protein
VADHDRAQPDDVFDFVADFHKEINPDAGMIKKQIERDRGPMLRADLEAGF